MSKQCASSEQAKDADRTTADQCGDGAKMIGLKKRTITERLIIANSLIASAIADSDNNQFHDSAKTTDDVPDNNVGDTISRQAAIDAIERILDRCEEIEAHLSEGDPDRVGYKMYPDWLTVWKYLHQVPSAQPERCEDCENFRKTRLLIPQPEKRTEERTETHACDLISRQVALDAMCSACGHDCDKSAFVYDAPQDEQVILCPEHYALTVLPPAQPEIKTGRWIPCSERLPEDEYVLISKKPSKISGDKWCVTIAIRVADPRSKKVQWRDIGFGIIPDDKILAWIPLPEPYKEGEGR